MSAYTAKYPLKISVLQNSSIYSVLHVPEGYFFFFRKRQERNEYVIGRVQQLPDVLVLCPWTRLLLFYVIFIY